uniref:MerC domain-containing protein n=1 Tax=Alexandrium monilatum TaxID=311494 RepID=A0A7S4QLC1_9DINO|mmetsp:Transcript_75064/g.223736  ORF Transcript_75064/g.223736 Transcript_75064/m.223736 type:complete len:153 (-) Transcript_75064:64-522(-)
MPELTASIPDFSAVLSASAAGASVLAAAAPALCAVHCAAMPFVALLLPGLRATGRVCTRSLGRKLAFYFVLPVGLVGNAAGYREHRSETLVATSLGGMSCILYAAAASPPAAAQNLLNAGGCALMLGSSYRARQIRQEKNCGCCGHADVHVE